MSVPSLAEIVNQTLLDAERARSGRLEDGLRQILTRLEKVPDSLLKEDEPLSDPDRADLAAFRNLLACMGFSQTPDGLRELLAQREVAAKAASDLSGEMANLRAEVAALTPGPWVAISNGFPPIGEYVHARFASSIGTHLWCRSDTDKCHDIEHWRRLPAALLTPPEKP